MQNTDTILQAPPTSPCTVYGGVPSDGDADSASCAQAFEREGATNQQPSATQQPATPQPAIHEPPDAQPPAIHEPPGVQPPSIDEPPAAARTHHPSVSQEQPSAHESSATPVQTGGGEPSVGREQPDSSSCGASDGPRRGDAAGLHASPYAGDASAAGIHNTDLGKRGEAAAVRFLKRRGMSILERNWTCNAGEADIIACDDEAIHFIEVKTRSNVNRGFPSEAVDRAKRERYERIAISYLAQCDVVDAAVMFDIISIVVTAPDRALLRFHRNAFSGCE